MLGKKEKDWVRGESSVGQVLVGPESQSSDAQQHVNANNSLHQRGLLADSISRLSVHM